MLLNAKEMEGYAISATDGVIGHVKDFYLDDEQWVIRYLVVETGSWLSSRKVLVSPIAVGIPNREQSLLPVSISREQVSKSPDIDTNESVSRQHEMTLSEYYAYPQYWGGRGFWGDGMYANQMMPNYAGSGGSPADPGKGQIEMAQRNSAQHEHDDPHLRSCNSLIRYHIQANDGEIGHVAGMLIDEQTWAVRYLVVDTSNWWLGHQVLIAPSWITDIDWLDATVSVDLTRQTIKTAPTYDAKVLPDREQERRLFDHYGRTDDQNTDAPQPESAGG